MKHVYLFALLIVFSVNAYAQSAFMPGYFIDNDGKRVDCLIRNTYKSQNPTRFEYKLTEDATIEIATIEDVQEVEISNTIHKYKRFEIDIDRSSNTVTNLTSFKEPAFKKELLFLRLLLAGEANLYAYYDRGDLQRFFYNTAGKDVEQLVYKKYNTSENIVAENNLYRNQLSFMITCNAISADKLNELKYQEKELIMLFAAYNKCIGSEAIEYNTKKDKSKLMLSVKGGINSSELEMVYYRRNGYNEVMKEYTFSSGRVMSPQVGIEAEYRFAFYNKRWSAFIEPSVILYNKEASGDYQINKYTKLDTGRIQVNYTHFSLPIGVKYSHHINANSRAYLKGALCFNWLSDDSDVYKTEGFTMLEPPFRHMDHFEMVSYAVGVGYEIKNKISVEANYYIKKNVVKDDTWEIDMVNPISVMVGYRIL